MGIFLSGFCMACFLASGIFFLKFWKASKDRFFISFAIACWLIAFERLVLLFMVMLDPTRDVISESKSFAYLIRLAAFIVIFFAIMDKNKRTKRIKSDT